MKKRMNRILSVLFAVVMVVSFCPISSFAEGQSSRSAATAGTGQPDAVVSTAATADQATDGETSAASSESTATDVLTDSASTATEVTPQDISAASAALTDLSAQSDALTAQDDLVNLGTFTNPTATSLGSVNKYAVFAQTYNKNGHMEGTIATNQLNAGGDAFGVTDNVEKYVDPDEAFLYFANITGLSNMTSTNSTAGRKWNVIMPDDTTFDKTYNNGNGIVISHKENGNSASASYNKITDLGATVNKVSETTYQIDFAAAFTALGTYASSAAEKPDTGVHVTKKIAPPTDQNDYEIDVVCDDGDDIVNLTMAELTSYKLVVSGNSSDKNYSLTINVTDNTSTATNPVTFDKTVSIDGANTAYGAEGGKILWNFGSGSCNVVFNQTLQGAILAPSGSVKVTSSHNGSIFAGTVENAQGCEIHQNGFKPQDSTASATVALQATKAISGRNFESGDAFTFTMTAESDNDTTGYTMPAGATATTTATSGSSQTVSFGDITFTKAGTYKFDITETSTAPTGIINSKATSTATVSVIGTTALTASVTYSGAGTDGKTFTNTYTAPTTTSFTATKVWDDSSNVYGVRPTSVSLQLMQNSVAYGEAVTVTGTGDSWTYTWNDLPTTTAAGAACTYSVTETAVPTGYTATYSSNGSTITNKLTAPLVKISKTDASSNATGVKLANCVFHITSTNLTPQIDKTVTTHSDGTIAIQGESASAAGLALPAGNYLLTEMTAPTGYEVHNGSQAFSVASDGTVSTTADNMKVGPDGVSLVQSDAPISTTAFTATKTWADSSNASKSRPASVKLQLMQNGVAYGEEVTVTGTGDTWTRNWTDLPNEIDGKTAVYTVTETTIPTGYVATYSSNGSTITNTYTEKSVAVPLSVTKSVSGTGYTGDEDFSFTLAAATDDTPLPAVSTATCKAGETATFGSIIYTTAGTYGYTITEAKGSTSGMTYDSTAHTATVTVTDNGAGALVASVKYDSTPDALTVTNAYQKVFKVKFQKLDADDHSVSLTGCKLCVQNTDQTITYGDPWYSVVCEPHEMELPAGDYLLVELEAPEGYDTTTPVAFTVQSDGTVTSAQMDSDGNVLIWDKKTSTTTTTVPKTSDTLQAWMIGTLGASIAAGAALSVIALRKRRQSGTTGRLK